MKRGWLTGGVSLMALALGMAFAAADMPSGLALGISILAGGSIACFHRAGVM